MADSVAKAYADALFEIALDENKCQEYREFIHQLRDTLDKKFIELLCHPRISKDEKKGCIDDVYAKVFDTVFIHFLKVLVDKNRFNYIEAICDEFDLDYVNHFHILQASICSAKELSEDEKQRLKEKLEKKYAQEVECNYEVDASLLAGVRVKIKDCVLDNTALNRLTKMKDRLMG